MALHRRSRLSSQKQIISYVKVILASVPAVHELTRMNFRTRKAVKFHRNVDVTHKNVNVGQPHI